LAAEGFTVLLLEYRGYGGNPGHPTEAGLAADVRAGRSFLAREGWTADRILYYGESLGCGVVTELAAHDPPAGLILRSPFVDLAAAGQRHYPFLPVGLLLWDRFPVADLVARVRVPTLVIYGDADTVIPPEQSLEVGRRAGGPTQVVAIAGADHNDAALFEGEQLVAAIVGLAERV
jgi:pimeloyl-ACP methyl ester carboxylesterase